MRTNVYHEDALLMYTIHIVGFCTHIVDMSENLKYNMCNRGIM